MAFVRYKKVKGKKYYQWVRNYREDGKHKQEILCHFGPHYDSPEAAVAGEKEKTAFYRNEASTLRQDAAQLRADILEEGKFRGSYAFVEYLHEIIFDEVLADHQIPHREAAMWFVELLQPYRNFLGARKDKLSPSLAIWHYDKWGGTRESSHITPQERHDFLDFHEYYEWGDYEVWEEECQAAIDLARKIIRYQNAKWRSDWEEDRANEHQAKLDKSQCLERCGFGFPTASRASMER